jgi:hypothetical protein
MRRRYSARVSSNVYGDRLVLAPTQERPTGQSPFDRAAFCGTDEQDADPLLIADDLMLCH